jgi:hypothetical protein
MGETKSAQRGKRLRDPYQTDAELVSPDGSSVGTSMVTWIGTPHFYREGKLIVIYVGGSEGVLSVLEAVMGSQFANGSLSV